MQSPTIFVVADEPDMLGLLTDLFKLAKLHCEAFATAEAFLEAYGCERPGCLLLDMSVLKMGGAELHRLLVQRQIVIPIIILTNLRDARRAMEALKGGALDFFEKPVDAGALLESVTDAIKLDSANRQALRIKREARQRFEQLTRREREIMGSMLESKSSKEISAQLNMSARTVEFHRARLMKKLGAVSLVELVRMYLTAFGCHCIHKYRHAQEVLPNSIISLKFFDHGEV